MFGIGSNLPQSSVGPEPSFSDQSITVATLANTYTQNIPQSPYVEIRNFSNQTYLITLSTQAQSNVQSAYLLPGQHKRYNSSIPWIQIQFKNLSAPVNAQVSPRTAPADGSMVGTYTLYGVNPVNQGFVQVLTCSVPLFIDESADFPFPPNLNAQLTMGPAGGTYNVSDILNAVSAPGGTGYIVSYDIVNLAAVPVIYFTLINPLDTGIIGSVAQAQYITGDTGRYYGIKWTAFSSGTVLLYLALQVTS